MPRLDNWSVRLSGDAYTAPEMRETLIIGTVSDSPKFETGSNIVTSAIVASSGRTVTTCNGTVYTLGLVDPLYKTWLDENSLVLDEDNPIKLRR